MSTNGFQCTKGIKEEDLFGHKIFGDLKRAIAQEQ